MKVVSIQIRAWEDAEEFNPRDLELKIGDQVIVETGQGLEAGEVVRIYNTKQKHEADLRPVLRKAIESDLKKIEYYREKKDEIFETAKAKMESHNLSMKLVDVHFAFDGSRITFAFTADGRIDFRELLRDLTRHFQKSIRLQQIGSRDEAKGLGGYGMCGREICCARFLDELKSVTTDMARLQEMTHKGSEKNSGLCGRLKCCLAYEADMYQELANKMPGLNERIKTPKGKGVVVARNILSRTVKVRLEDGGEIEISGTKH